jgi:hypothetical protein
MPQSWLLVALSLLAPPLLVVEARAQEIWDGPALSYSNLEFGYERRTFDEAGVGDADGFHAGFSFAPIPLLYFAGDFHYANVDQFLSEIDEIDFIDARAGAGLRVTLLGALSVYAEGGFAYGKYDPALSPNSYDSVGFYAEPGLKVGLFGRLEASVAGDFVVLDEETLVGIKGGLMLGITDNFGITIDASASDRTDYLGIGVRFSW